MNLENFLGSGDAETELNALINIPRYLPTYFILCQFNSLHFNNKLFDVSAAICKSQRLIFFEF